MISTIEPDCWYMKKILQIDTNIQIWMEIFFIVWTYICTQTFFFFLILNFSLRIFIYNHFNPLFWCPHFTHSILWNEKNELKNGLENNLKSLWNGLTLLISMRYKRLRFKDIVYGFGKLKKWLKKIEWNEKYFIKI